MKSGPDVFADALVPLPVLKPGLPMHQPAKPVPAIRSLLRRRRLLTGPIASGLPGSRRLAGAQNPPCGGGFPLIGACRIAANGYRFEKWQGKPIASTG